MDDNTTVINLLIAAGSLGIGEAEGLEGREIVKFSPRQSRPWVWRNYGINGKAFASDTTADDFQ